MLKKPRCGMRIINSLLLSGGGNPIASRGSLCSLGFMIGFLIRIEKDTYIWFLGTLSVPCDKEYNKTLIKPSLFRETSPIIILNKRCINGANFDLQIDFCEKA